MLAVLGGSDAAISALPYRYNLAISRYAIEARCNLCDRRLTETLLEPILVGESPIEDVVVVRVHCTGRSNGRRV